MSQQVAGVQPDHPAANGFVTMTIAGQMFEYRYCRFRMCSARSA